MTSRHHCTVAAGNHGLETSSVSVNNSRVRRLHSTILSPTFCLIPPPTHVRRRSIHTTSFLGDTSRCSRNSSSEASSSSVSSLEELASQLAQDRYQNVVVLIGAGASVSAGIPDFRSPGTGLYDQLRQYNLPFPEAIFDLEFYRENSSPFVDLAKVIWPGQEEGPKPTLTHFFLRLLETKGMLRRIYTQNIDGLEALADVSDERLVECHGHFRSASCIQCRAQNDVAHCFDTMVSKGEAPSCSECGSLVKPDIVFFGEELPRRFQQLVGGDCEDCDLLLVIGTSLLVMPVAGIPSWVPKGCPRVLLNRELVGDFVYSQSKRDLFLEGDCDESVRKLCQAAEWEHELDSNHR